MSEQQYTRLFRTRLKDLNRLPAGRLMALLSTRPEWVQNAVIKSLMRTCASYLLGKSPARHSLFSFVKRCGCKNRAYQRDETADDDMAKLGEQQPKVNHFIVYSG